jgi:hypothetical protein
MSRRGREHVSGESSVVCWRAEPKMSRDIDEQSTLWCDARTGSTKILASWHKSHEGGRVNAPGTYRRLKGM